MTRIGTGLTMNIRIKKLSLDDAAVVFDFVPRLLSELGKESDDLGALDRVGVLSVWRAASERIQAFAAVDGNVVVGVLTLAESFAIYANGAYGIINEMYVTPSHRSSGVGAKLVDATKDYGAARGWSRIDVTAPESERWARSKKFYKDCGFTFAGPKLRVCSPPCPAIPAQTAAN